MVFGGVTTERLQLNEESIWTKSGDYIEKLNGHKYLNQVRDLLFQGKHAEAEELAIKRLMSKRLAPGTNTYQTLGDLHIEFKNVKNYRNYYRDLNLENATANTYFEVGNTRYRRKIFSSAIDSSHCYADFCE